MLNLKNTIIIDQKWWIRERLTANGLSSSKIIKSEGKEDKKASRRVEFRVRTKAHEKIIKIVEEGKIKIVEESQ